jgi:hypothetical protein
MADLFILLGAEGCSEAQDEPWLREPTKEEVDAHREELGYDDKGKSRLGKLSIDMSGRPYFLMVVTDEAPTEIRARAEEHLRVVRL